MIGAVLLEIAAFLLFGALALVWPDRRGQPLLRRDLAVDAVYFLISLVVYGPMNAALFAGLGALGIVRPAAGLSFPLQVAGVLLLYDLMQYGLHRMFHAGRLWPFHAVHHSAREIDILTSVRFHPVNFVVYTGAPMAALLILGFPTTAFAAVALFNFLMGCLTHANLNWTYGPLRFVLASPIFHRWHHAELAEGERACNFSPNFPVWDLLFGTFRMPRGRTPEGYGAPEVPETFAGQLAHPFAPRTS